MISCLCSIEDHKEAWKLRMVLHKQELGSNMLWDVSDASQGPEFVTSRAVALFHLQALCVQSFKKKSYCEYM